MSNNYQQSDSSIDESKESVTSQFIMSEQESQEQAFSNYSTQNNYLNLLNFDDEENFNDNAESLKVIITKGKQKDQFSQKILNINLKKTSNKKKVKRIKEFQVQEDIRLLKLVHQYGRQFSRIVKQFPKRTVSMLKNRYYKNLRYRWEELLGIKYIEEKNQQKTKNQIDGMNLDNQSLNRKDLINMIPNTYSCPIIGNMLSSFIIKMDQFLKTQF
ncbi:unnamed protein product [Paramecium pentaurelia]|uniref:HTH myb-type domain-containing protein n=1 Tax=Paramecium pentaurelia TaxID=43138 RepID=A0A8S1RXA4_9CILI|nr:unnamed protein product [Paramecium pentaurelia]